ncbi:DUF5994 family protein [Streptomyces sp. NPDC001286]
MESSRTAAEAMSTDDAHTYRMPLPRLVLAEDVGHGPLDGAWWPRCDVLELELPSLVALLEPERGGTVRVRVDASQWPKAPRTVMAPGRVISVEPTEAADGAGVITLDCETVGRWMLMVVSHEEPADTAARLLAGAGQ